MMTGRRVMRVGVAGAVIETFLLRGAGLVDVVDGLPEDAARTAMWVDHDHDTVWVVFEHSSFPEISDGEIIPAFTPVVRKPDAGS